MSSPAPSRRPFARAWLDGDEAARALLPAAFGDDAGSIARRREAVLRGARRTISPSVKSALLALEATLPPSAARYDNIVALSQGGVACVVTGQQVGLFLGPLYTLCKAAAAVALARRLSDETGVRCVPIFWLATEDHDWEEVRTARVHAHGDGALGEAGRVVSLALPPEAAQAARTPLAARVLDSAITPLTAALTELLGDCEATQLLAAHYRPGVRVADAFARVLATLFAADGLVLIDPRDPAFLVAAAPVHARAFALASDLDARLAARCRALADAHLAEQVPHRPGTSLSFFHPAGRDGARHRLVRRDGRWQLPDGSALGDEEIAARIGADAGCVSASALLRPIVQDALLPTAAYVGGPAEVAYLAESTALYEAFALPPPLAFLRTRVRLVDTRTERRLAHLGLAAADLEAPRDTLIARLAAAGTDEESTSLTELGASLATQIDALASRDPQLARAAARTRATVERALARLTARAAAARVRRDAATTAALDAAQRVLFPEGAPQERVLAFAGFAARRGIRQLCCHIAAAAGRPLDGAVHDLRIDQPPEPA